MLPFTTRLLDPATGGPGSVIGMTTYMNIDADTPRVEIGSTWNAASTHGSGTNPDSKLLLLRHAFETLGCPAVEFRTHWLNHQSREAIARLGAKQDGVLRSHSRTATARCGIPSCFPSSSTNGRWSATASSLGWPSGARVPSRH